MRTHEDPCRDPASEARDDEASEPRATPETDSMGYTPTVLTPAWRLMQHARRLERQRDELLEALYAIEERFVDGCDTCDDWKFMGETARAAIAAVKGGNG
jgi:hypothetical protein